MKALVIGATGIIGNHVVRSLLEQGIEVRAFSRGTTSLENLEGLDVEWFKGDLYDGHSLSAAMGGCSWVFHTAPYYPTNAFQKEEHLKRGMKGLKSVLKAVSSQPIDRFVYTSSLTTIGPPPYFGQLADESCAYAMKDKPPHPYFAIKYLMEEEVKKQAQKGLPAIIVNPTGCFGPYELKPVSLCLIPQLVRRRIPAYVDHAINVVDVADVGQGHFLAAKKGKIGERYILGGHNVDVAWTVETICKLAGVVPPRLSVPVQLAASVAWISEWISFHLLKKPPVFPLLGIRFVQYGQHLDISKATKELGYKASPMEDCFVRAIEWFRKIGYC